MVESRMRMNSYACKKVEAEKFTFLPKVLEPATTMTKAQSHHTWEHSLTHNCAGSSSLQLMAPTTAFSGF
jgi:hypothetical protein